MSNRHLIPPVDGATRVWPDELSHTIIMGTTRSGKAALNDMLRLTEAEFRIVKGERDAGAAGDEACA